LFRRPFQPKERPGNLRHLFRKEDKYWGQFLHSNNNLAKLDIALIKSTTVMVIETEKAKLGKKRGMIKPSCAFVYFSFLNVLILEKIVETGLLEAEASFLRS
jgi:hypothetical protein